MGVFPHTIIKFVLFVRLIREINRGNPVIYTLNLIRLINKKVFYLG